MPNCVLHHDTPATNVCDRCGAPICDLCYDALINCTSDGDEHLCPDCYRGALNVYVENAKYVKSVVLRELIIILVGMLVGGALDIVLLVALGANFTGDVASSALIMAYLPFITGSLMTIIKKIFVDYFSGRVNGGDESSCVFNIAVLAMTIGFNLGMAPIFTLVRLVQRSIDTAVMNGVLKDFNDYVSVFDKYVDGTLAEQPDADELYHNGIAKFNAAVEKASKMVEKLSR